MPTSGPRSTLESFLDEYQLVRLVVSSAGMLLTGIFWVAGWSRGSSPVPIFVALGGIAAHSLWCRVRHVRTPRVMLAIDTTLLGVLMFTLQDDAAVMTGVFAVIGLVAVLFTERWWRVGFLVYVTAWYVAAFLGGAGTSAESLRTLSGTLFTVMAIMAITARVRGWLGRLDAERSQMVGTVSHELRNNLTGVLGITELLATMPDLNPAEVRDLLVLAHEQAGDASEIVEDLLTASRLKAAALTMNLGSVNVNEEVTTVTHRLRDTEIGLDLARDLEPAWADALRVRQVIRNLVTNAVRYGGPEITVITRPAGGSIQVIVRDNGAGVRVKDEATIFQPYRRSTSTRTDASSIGLGLWISQDLAHAMRGRLEYRRRDGSTEFVLSLPDAGRHLERTDPGVSIVTSP